MLPTLLSALIAGLVGSPHCVAMCGGFASACSHTAAQGAAYHIGRWATYAGLGALVAAAGDLLPGPGWVVHVLSLVLTGWFAAALAGLTPTAPLAVPGLTRAATAALRRPGLAARLAFGALTGLLPCGLVYATLGMMVGQPPLTGAAGMIAFGLGTTPLLAGAAAGVRRVLASTPTARRVLGALVFLTGAGSIVWRAGWLAGLN